MANTKYFPNVKVIVIVLHILESMLCFKYGNDHVQSVAVFPAAAGSEGSE